MIKFASIHRTIEDESRQEYQAELALEFQYQRHLQIWNLRGIYIYLYLTGGTDGIPALWRERREPLPAWALGE